MTVGQSYKPSIDSRVGNGARESMSQIQKLIHDSEQESTEIHQADCWTKLLVSSLS
jgi:hypothetical protein